MRVRFAREACLEAAKFCYSYHRRGYPNSEKLMWLWLFRWAGMPA